MFNRLASIIVIFSFLSLTLLFSGYTPPTVEAPPVGLPMPTIYTPAQMDEIIPEIEDAIKLKPIALATVDAGIDGKQLKCLQENIYFEARNQDTVGQFMVALVTTSRMMRENYPDTLCAVTFQKMQFSWANNGRLKPNLNNYLEKKAWDHAGMVANFMIDSGIANYVNDVTHYHTTKVNPKWSKSPKLKPVLTIGDHVFYSENI